MRRHATTRQGQKGQSMVEYTVVISILAFALMTAGPGSMSDVRDSIRDHNRSYTYAVSLSTYPNSEDLTELAQQYAEDNLGDATLQDVLDASGYSDEFEQYLSDSFPVSLDPTSVDIGIDDIRGFIGF